jgi:hypothetical protein
MSLEMNLRNSITLFSQSPNAVEKLTGLRRQAQANGLTRIQPEIDSALARARMSVLVHSGKWQDILRHLTDQNLTPYGWSNYIEAWCFDREKGVWYRVEVWQRFGKGWDVQPDHDRKPQPSAPQDMPLLSRSQG